MAEPADRLVFLEFEESDTEVRLGLELAIPPFGQATVVADDDSADSRALLQDLAGAWTNLWPAMLERLREAMENLDVGIQPDSKECTGYVSRTRPGYFMSDKSDVYLSLEFAGESPDWDYFLKNGKIVHFQPVF